MLFPLIYLFIPYGLILALCGLFFFFNIFHIMRYSIGERNTYLLLIAYGLSFTGLLLVSAVFFMAFDWQYQVSLEEILPFSSEGANSYGL